MLNFKKRIPGSNNLLPAVFAATVAFSIALLAGCGGSEGLVEMPDKPIPKPETITVYGDNGDEVEK